MATTMLRLGTCDVHCGVKDVPMHPTASHVMRVRIMLINVLSVLWQQRGYCMRGARNPHFSNDPHAGSAGREPTAEAAAGLRAHPGPPDVAGQPPR
jgi:hypothetical protein